jgi:hypothetical protein
MHIACCNMHIAKESILRLTSHLFTGSLAGSIGKLPALDYWLIFGIGSQGTQNTRLSTTCKNKYPREKVTYLKI